MDFELTSAKVADDIVVVTVTGEIDLLAAPALKQQLAAEIDRGARLIVVDLNATTFLDSTTLGVLIGANKRLRAEDGALVIACGNPSIRTIFAITLLDRVFDIVDSVDAAVAALRALDDPERLDSSGAVA